MATKTDAVNKITRKSIFSFKRTYSSPSSDPPEDEAPTGSTSAEDAHGILNRRGGIHNFGVALELLKSVGEGNELLAPLKAICGGLKILVDTAEAIQKNDEDLRDLNTRLHRQLDALEQQDKTLSASELNFAHKEIEYFVKLLRTYILDLNRVQKILDTLHHKEGVSTKKFFKKALMAYPVREEIKDCSRQLDESFQLFMNSVTSFIAHQAVLLRKDMANMQMRADVKKANDALAQLPCSDARGNQHESCLEGTRAVILREITGWAKNATDKPVLCLVDQAGTGKSTISFHLAQKWEKEGFSIARFFFSLTNSVISGTDFATTLARDLGNSKNSPSLRSFILNAINDHPNVTGHSIKEKIEWFVFEPLKRMRDDFAKGLDQVRKTMDENACMTALENVHPEISEREDIKSLERSYREVMEQMGKDTGDVACMNALKQVHVAYTGKVEKVYTELLTAVPIVVVDALDECSRVDRVILLQSFLRFLAASPENEHPLKLFLTCRPEEDIVTLLYDSQYNKQVRQAGSQASSSTHDDITLYAKVHLVEILCPLDIDLFVNRANGLFIWASTAKEFLKEADDLSACFSNLMSQDTKESPIYSLYDTILRSAVDRIGRDQDGRRRLKKALQSVCAAREPLGTTEMDELLGMSKGVAYLVVKKRLSSVLSGGSEGIPIQALHPTFIEYLRSGSQQPESMIFSYGEAETLLAGGCLDVLLSPQLHYDICGVMRQDRLVPENQDIEGFQRRLEEKTSPGLRYAAVHGLSHVALCLGDKAVLRRLRDFLTNKLLYWVELMSLIGRVYHLMQSIHHLKSQIENGMRYSMELLNTTDKNWCEESHRLVQPFQATIEKSALQVYFSALPFTPPTSQISHFYGQGFVGRIPKVLRGAWRVQSRYTVLSGHARSVNCLSFSPDGQRLASGSEDYTVRLWDATTGAAIGNPPTGHTGRVECLSFSPDGQKLASSSQDKTIRFWDAATGGADGELLTGHTGHVVCLSFSSDSRILALGSNDHTIRLWNAMTGAAIGDPLTGHTSGVTCLSFSPDSRSLASGSDDGSVRLWNTTTGAAVGGPLAGHTHRVSCLSFSPDGRQLASGSKDYTIRLWDAKKGVAIGEPLTDHIGEVNCLSFSPDSRSLASGSDDGSVRLWNTTTGATVGGPLTGHIHGVSCLSFSPDGRQLASGSGDSTIRLWDATTGATIGEPLTGHTSRVTRLSFSPDGRQLASGSWDSTVRLWDATQSAYVGEKQAGHASAVISLSFSPDGQQLASGSTDCTIRLWDATTGAAIGEPLTGHTSYVVCLSFSLDGRLLASGSLDQTIRLWDVISGAEVGEPLSGHTDCVIHLSFSPDGQFLASASWDRTVRLWDVLSGATVGQPVRYDGYIWSMALHMRDSSLFLAVDGGAVDGGSAVWRLSEDALVKLPSGEQPPASPSRATFDAPWTYISSSPGLRFSLPSSFRCRLFLSHEQKLAYGGEDGSVIIIDCSHLV